MKLAVMSTDPRMIREIQPVCNDIKIECVELPFEPYAGEWSREYSCYIFKKEDKLDVIKKDISKLIENEIDIFIIQFLRGYYGGFYGLDLCLEASKHGIEGGLDTNFCRHNDKLNGFLCGYWGSGYNEGFKPFLTDPYATQKQCINEDLEYIDKVQASYMRRPEHEEKRKILLERKAIFKMHHNSG